MIKLSTIKPNPNNPRIIKDEKFHKLVASIRDFPKMMRLRPIVVDKDNVIQGGNMRYRAIQELKMTEIPDNWVASADDFTPEELERFVIEDNVGFGEWDWDMVFNLYDAALLEEWGMDLPVDTEPPPDPDGLELEEKKELSVSFDDEASMQKLYDELSDRGFKCRILTL